MVRKQYDKLKVKQLRMNRKTLMPRSKDMSRIEYQQWLGDLQAAGHLKFTAPGSKVDMTGDKYNISFDTCRPNGNGEAPHLIGYLESVHDADTKTYRIRGWVNKNGTIRLELVT